MTPDDIYSLPTTRTEPWFESDLEVRELLGIQMHDFDCDRAREEGASELCIEHKLFCSLDGGERSASVSAAVFQGRPIALIRAAGRGQEDFQDAYVTDAEACRRALDYVMQWRSNGITAAVAKADEELPALGAFYNTVLTRVGEEIRLAKADHFSKDGTLLFDEVAYRQSFDEIVRPAFKDTEEAEFKEGIAGTRMRRLVVEAILRAVPHGIPALAVDTEDLEDAGVPLWHRENWHAVLVKSGDTTYSLGLDQFSKTGKWFAWSSGLGAEAVGTGELFDRQLAAWASDPQEA